MPSRLWMCCSVVKMVTMFYVSKSRLVNERDSEFCFLCLSHNSLIFILFVTIFLCHDDHLSFWCYSAIATTHPLCVLSHSFTGFHCPSDYFLPNDIMSPLSSRFGIDFSFHPNLSTSSALISLIQSHYVAVLLSMQSIPCVVYNFPS